MTQPVADKEEWPPSATIARGLASIILVIAGMIAIGLGVSALWCPAGAAVVLGAIVVLLGVLIGLG